MRPGVRLVLILVAALGLAGCDLVRDASLPRAAPRVDAPARLQNRLPPGSATAGVTIYLPRLFEDGSLGLQGVPRVVAASDDPAWEMLQALIRGPDGDERAANFQYALDRRTRVLNVHVDGGTCTIEFGQGLEQVHGRPFSELVYWSIVFTLTEVPGIQRVVLTRGGAPLQHLGDPPFALPAQGTRDAAPAWARPR